MSKKTQTPATAAYIAAAAYADNETLLPAAAEAMRDVARDAWLASDEERDWRVGGDAWGGDSGTVSAVCPSEIADRLSDDCRDGEWGDRTETLWVNDWATPIDPVTDEPIYGERVDVTTTIEVDEPDCEKSEHDWQSPHDIVGGCEENPGVQGNGGGVVITEVCAHCGMYKITDTWAQNRSTGEQGLTSVEYADADDRSEQWLKNEARAKNE